MGVTAKAVHDVHAAYDAYESHMYAGNTYTTANGFNRGIAGFFDPELFHSLDGDVKSTACRIPFSQPKFIFVILTVWSLSCVGEFRELFRSARFMLLYTKSVSSMADALVQAEDDEGAHKLIVVGLTHVMKAIIALIALTRLVICCVLLWMGCRWLVATTNFGDLILNSVALVFVLELKDFLYMILIPSRNKRDLQNTTIEPPKEKQNPSLFLFMGSFFVDPSDNNLGLRIYIHVPSSLPGYKWDLREVCTQWTTKRYSLTKIPNGDL